MKIVADAEFTITIEEIYFSLLKTTICQATLKTQERMMVKGDGGRMWRSVLGNKSIE